MIESNYKKYMYINGQWEAVSDEDDQSYYTKQQVDTLFVHKQTFELFENDNYYFIDQYKINGTYPKKDKLIFSGWYTDDTCVTPYMSNTGIAYAKFVDENIFQVKCDSDSGSHTAIRFVSTLDRDDYQSAGFLIYGQYGTASVKRERNASTLYTSISNFELTDFSPESQYFFTYTITGASSTLDPNLWQIKAQFVTVDGTKVYTDFISPIYKFNTEETILPSYEGDNIPLLVEIANRIKQNYTKDEVDIALVNKVDKTTISTDQSSTTATITLADNHEYRYTTDLTSLTLTMPSGDFIASVVFSSGSTPTSMTYDSSIKWSGDDVTNNAFVPVASKTYNIVFWYDGININAISRSA